MFYIFNYIKYNKKKIFFLRTKTTTTIMLNITVVTYEDSLLY